MAIEYPSSLTTSTPPQRNDDEQNTSSHNTIQSTSPTVLQYIFAGIILGSAAGLTMYTKKTGQLLNQMERMNANALARKPKRKPGPLTKEEWEKTRNLWEKDDL